MKAPDYVPQYILRQFLFSGGNIMSIINVENLTFGYDGSSDNIFENVSFHIDTDWKLGFT